jgi:hypothetical protein
MANSALTVANTDFASIRADLKTYLNSQSNFKDYNFDGSNMAVLVDVLAYNTFMQNFYLNQVASESFLDSAQLRDSIISHAKTLNYLPKSDTSATAVVDLEIFPANTPGTINVPKYTSFTTTVDSSTYTFTTNEGRTLQADSDGRYVANSISIYEGEIVTELFQVNTSNTDQRFVLSNKEIDTSSLTVKISTSSSDTSNAEWKSSLTSIGVSGTSNVYYIVPAEGGKYELQFGDGVLGRPLINGNIVEATYRKCTANAANEANTFTCGDTIQGYSNVVTTTVSKASGGGFRESNTSIKFNAPKALSIQDRTVTVDDYKTILQQEFNDIETLNVYGGEEASPPEFGKVLISVDLKNADGIPNSKKKIIEDFVKLRAPLGIAPKVIDPVFLYVDVTSKVVYNPNVTVKSDSEIESLVSAAIDTHATDNINSFNAKLRTSKLSAAIDGSDPSILNSDTSILLQKKFTPTLNTKESHTLEYVNEIYREIPDSSSIFPDGSAPVLSTEFTFDGLTGCSLRDDGNGVMQVVQQGSSVLTIVSRNIGTVDYTNGTVKLTNFEVSGFTGDGITVSANPVSKTLKSNKNIILSYNKTPSITIQQERI